MILAAGYGTRLRPLTQQVPKALVPVLGRALLGHIAGRLCACGATGIVVNAHHRAVMLRGFLDDARLPVPWYLSLEEQILGVAGGIGRAREYLGEDDYFMVHNGDVLSSIPLGRMLDAYRQHTPLGAMVLHDHPLYNNISVDHDNWIVDIRDTLQVHNAVRKLAYTGIAFFSADFLDCIPEGPCDLVPLLLEAIRRDGHTVRAIVAEGFAWRDVGSLASYFQAHRDILMLQVPLVDAQYRPEGPVFLGEGTSVEAGAQLGGFVSAGRNCRIEAGSGVENSILWDGAVVPRGSVLRNAIVGPGWVTHVS